jgi:hypothetical protein
MRFCLLRHKRGSVAFSGIAAALLSVALGCVLSGVPDLTARQRTAEEFQLKATYLYNFGRFVVWPPNAAAKNADSFAICVFGKDPFGPVLDATFAGETLDGKPVVARRIATVPEAAACRILFVAASEERRLNDVLKAVDKAGVLTVSDIPDFCQRGGMIQFVLQGNNLRFEVDLAATEGAGLMLSSELLKVALAVRGKPSDPKR